MKCFQSDCSTVLGSSIKILELDPHWRFGIRPSWGVLHQSKKCRFPNQDLNNSVFMLACTNKNGGFNSTSQSFLNQNSVGGKLAKWKTSFLVQANFSKTSKISGKTSFWGWCKTPCSPWPHISTPFLASLHCHMSSPIYHPQEFGRIWIWKGCLLEMFGVVASGERVLILWTWPNLVAMATWPHKLTLRITLWQISPTSKTPAQTTLSNVIQPHTTHPNNSVLRTNVKATPESQGKLQFWMSQKRVFSVMDCSFFLLFTLPIRFVNLTQFLPVFHKVTSPLSPPLLFSVCSPPAPSAKWENHQDSTSLRGWSGRALDFKQDGPGFDCEGVGSDPNG